MKLFLLCSLIFMALPTFAGPQRDEIEALLPKELVEALKKNQKEIEKGLKAKIYKKDKDALYLNYFGVKGDTTLGLKDNSINYVYAEVSNEIQKKNPNLFSKAYSWLTKEEKDKLSKKDSEDTSHEKGRYIILDFPSESMKLEFYNNEKRTLRSVLFWSLGSKAP